MLIFNLFLQERFGQAVKRNAASVTAVLRTVDDGDRKQLLTTKDLYIYVPRRFEEIGMAHIEDNFSTMAYYAMVVGDSYGVVATPTFNNLTPSSIQTIKIGEDEYFELLFEANSLVMESTRCFKDSASAYLIYNEFIAKPNMCAFFDYDDALLCMSTLGAYAGVSLEKTNVATEIIIATITRNNKNLDESYRHAIAKDKTAEPEYIGLRNIQYGVTNLPTAIMGSYSDIGIDSLLVKPATKVEKYERLLRI